ncbi:MAG: hypothetical protein CSA35_07850 [Dethiosulfovibrio peptidovorans]|nr:MAG: hypothetical protein CSA35_07850 [Dethiosulfovibrio peptidovorans]
MITTLERVDCLLLDDDVTEALRRWALSFGPQLDRARMMVRSLAHGVLLWGVVDPGELVWTGSWGPDVLYLVLGAGTVGRALSQAVEEEGPWLKSMATAALGKGQERFFRRVEEWARGKRLPVGSFYAPGSAGALPLTLNVAVGQLLRLAEIDMIVHDDGRLEPTYSWVGMVPLGKGSDRVSFLCSECSYAPSCPLRRDDP